MGLGLTYSSSTTAIIFCASSSGCSRKRRDIFWTEEAATLVRRYISQERALSVDMLRAQVTSRSLKTKKTRLVKRTDATGRSVLVEPDDAPLWLAEDGDSLSVKFWDKCFAKVARTTKVKCTPHTLRHTYAVATLAHLIAEEAKRIARQVRHGGASESDLSAEYYLGALEELRRLMGHAYISTTQGYLRYVPAIQDLLRDAHG